MMTLLKSGAFQKIGLSFRMENELRLLKSKVFQKIGLSYGE
jgi:hypothetical protein